MHLSEDLTFGQVKYWAGWIPAKLALVISLSVDALLAIVFEYFKISQSLGSKVFAIYIVILLTTVISVWVWGSKKTKYQIVMLKDFIDSQKKSIRMFKDADEIEYKSDIEWHTNKLKIATGFLFKINYGFDRPENFDDAKKLAIKDLENVASADSSFRLWTGNKQWTAEEMIAEINNETDQGKKFVDNFLDGLNFFEEHEEN